MTLWCSHSAEDNQRPLNSYLKKKYEFSQQRKGRKSCSVEGTVRAKARRHVGNAGRPVWLDYRVPWREMMGDGIGKESNDCQGIMNAGLRDFASAIGKPETWGRGLSRRAVWLERRILQFPSVVCFPSPSRNLESRGEEGVQSSSPRRWSARPPDTSLALFPPHQVQSPSPAIQTNSSTSHDKEAHLEPGQDLQTSNL